MSEWLERFLELESKQKLAILAGVPLLVLVAFFLLVLGPRMARTAEMNQRIEGMLEDRARKQAETADLEERARQVAALDRDLTLAMTQLPDEKELPDLLSAISNLGRESGLDILVFRQRPETYQQFYARVPVEMEVRGTYHQVAGFLDRVGRLDRIVNVSDIVVTDPEPEDGEMLLRANTRVTTFRFLDEAERKQLTEAGKIPEAPKPGAKGKKK